MATARKATKRKTARRAAKPTSAGHVGKPVAAQPVTVLVNGQISSDFPQYPADRTLADLVREVGQAHSMRGCTVKINGAKVEAPDLTMQLTGVKSVELISKETRG